METMVAMVEIQLMRHLLAAAGAEWIWDTFCQNLKWRFS